MATKESEYYTEQHRPQFHFSPEKMWMNDPNGLVYFEGEYHLFYQYYPNDIVWGPMHWGHAVSKDLVSWEHLPIALYPDNLGLIFSGSAVIDWKNTSGLGKEGMPPMIAIFTHHSQELEKQGKIDYQYQSIAFSNDKGRTWTKYENNPVIKNPGVKDFRDPKVIWHDASKKWIMVFSVYDKAQFYSSTNLIDWKYESEFGIENDKRLWECPDLFPLKVEETGETKWILITSIQQKGPNGGSATSYFVGDFDGKKFIGNSNNQKWIDYGTDNYALVTWSDVPNSENKKLAIGWMSNWQYAQIVPTQTWRSAMTLPRVLTLHKVGNDYEIFNVPVDELKSLETATTLIETKNITEKLEYTQFDNGLVKISLQFEKPKSGKIEIKYSNSKNEYISLGVSADQNHFFIDRQNAGKRDFNENFAKYHTAPLTDVNGMIELDIYFDVASVEIFANKGRTVMTDIFFANKVFNKLEIIPQNTTLKLNKGSISKLKSIWK